MFFQSRFNIIMVVPVTRIDGDDSCTCLHESPRQQCALSILVTTVTITQLDVFLRQIKCFTYMVASDHF